MSQHLSNTLLEIYLLDREDYEKLLRKMTEFEDFLENSSGAQNMDEFDEELNDFWEIRQECFSSLKQRAREAAGIYQQLAAKLGVPACTLYDLKPYMPEDKFQEFAGLADLLQKQMRKVLELDGEIIPRLRTELEAVKAELNRLQNAKNIKNVYRQKGPKDARFIDKIK